MADRPSTWRSWNSTQLVHWIISIDPSYRDKYNEILTQSLTQHKITGRHVDDLDMSDLKVNGINNLNDRVKIYIAIQRLIATNNNIDIEEERLLLKAITMSMEKDDVDVINVSMSENTTNKEHISNNQLQTQTENHMAQTALSRCLVSVRSVHRTKDRKLILKIMDRILSDPSNVKYGSINVSKLSAKLSNHDAWLRFLIGAGFRTSKDGERLIFDCSMIHRLSIFHQITMSYDMDSVPEEQKEAECNPIQTMYGLQNAALFLSMNQKTGSMVPFHCICGKALQTVNNSHTLYDGHGSACNICLTFGARYQSYHHCTDTQNKNHPHGFDLCDKCAEMLFESMGKISSLIWSGSCDGSVGKCFFVSRLMSVMTTCINRIQIDENIDLNYLIHDYFHILENHNDYVSYNLIYEFITCKLGECQASECSCFASIYGENYDAKQKDDSNTAARQKIWDTIHCYFYHGFDVGLRLKISDFAELSDRKNADSDPIPLRLRKLLMNKRNIYQKELNLFTTRVSGRFGQLKHTEYENKQQDDKVFHFGFMFEYQDKPSDVLGTHEYIRVYPKYSSLKEELIKNKISPLNVQQYNKEYQKAVILLNSFFCKKHYSQPFIQSTNNLDISSMGFISDGPVSFGINHLLSLMAYCNYDTLQYLFSKTYRENNGRDHEHFYHLGKNIKIAVKMFGKSTKDDKKFYHGIREILHIKHLNKPHDTRGTSICCPLSTSSSFEVATNFTMDENGMIVEFCSADRGGKINIKSFDCAWLSNYPNEKEHLFIQNGFLETLKICNIYFMSDGSEYKNILKALTITLQAVCSFVGMISIVTIHDSDVQSKLLQTLIVAILQDRLSHVFESYPKFGSLNDYARKMISNCCESQEAIMIHPLLLIGSKSVGAELMEKRLSFLYHVFVHNQSKCARLDYIVAIFPNVVFVDIWDVPLCDIFMQRLFQYLTDNFVNNALEILRIVPNPIGWKVSETITKYTSAFDNIGYTMVEIKNKHTCGGSCFGIKAPVELQIAKHSCKYIISRTCTGAGCIHSKE